MRVISLIILMTLLLNTVVALPFNRMATSAASTLVSGNQIPDPITSSGWRVYWNITYDNGLGLYNISYDGRLIINSVLLTGITVTYMKGQCWFYDEIGSRPPDQANLSRYENATLSLDDVTLSQPAAGGFNLNESADVPGYTYGQEFAFLPDGRFQLLTRISGGGCFDIHTYKPDLRIDFNLGDSRQDTISAYDGNGWLPMRTEGQLVDSGTRDPSNNYTNWMVSNGPLTYYFTPFDYPRPTTVPPTLLVEAYHRGQVENSHAPAVFSPFIYINGERVYRTHVVIWYIAQHTQDVFRNILFKVPVLSGLMFYPGK